MRQIPLTQGKFALVDDEDFAWLNKWKWFYSKDAKRAVGKRRHQKQLHMSRVIMNPSPDKIVDHINHDVLDNRKSNLRICDWDENNRNKRSLSNISGFKGVTPASNSYKNWRVFVRGKLIGYFDSKEEAAQAYNKKAKELFGEFAYQNIL